MKTALVTGGSRGLGRAICVALEAAGCKVLAPTRQELDLAQPASITAYLPKCANVDILVNNAGINNPAPLESLSADNWRETLQINVSAALQLIQSVAPGMRARRWGRIVNMSSMFSLVTKEKRAAYTASKAALNGLTATSAVELAEHNILVNAVAPGYVDTDLTRKNNPPEALKAIVESIPLRRLAQPHEIAQLVTFLASGSNSYITGQTIVIDGGFTLK